VAASIARPARLLDDVTLESSSVAANSAMNRERQLARVNSYARELGFNPLHVMPDAVKNQPAVASYYEEAAGAREAHGRYGDDLGSWANE
jgi:hypothetical protein